MHSMLTVEWFALWRGMRHLTSSHHVLAVRYVGISLQPASSLVIGEWASIVSVDDEDYIVLAESHAHTVNRVYRGATREASKGRENEVEALLCRRWK